MFPSVGNLYIYIHVSCGFSTKIQVKFPPLDLVFNSRLNKSMAPIAVGDVIPNAILSYLDEQDQLQTVSVHSLAAGKKVILFAVPGAFTPTCSNEHVPSFIEKADELKSKGVDDILCVSGMCS